MKNNIDLDYELALELIDDIKNDPMGTWFYLPDNFPSSELERIKETAKKINESSEYLVCVGIGGSYLGARAVYEALLPLKNQKTKLLFAGNSMSERELKKVLDELKDKDFSLNIISKSGTTLESAADITHLTKLCDLCINRNIISCQDSLDARKSLGLGCVNTS